MGNYLILLLEKGRGKRVGHLLRLLCVSLHKMLWSNRLVTYKLDVDNNDTTQCEALFGDPWGP